MNVTRFLALAVAATLLPSAAAPVDLAELKARGTLRVLASADEEPSMWNFKAGDAGVERELMEGFAKLHKLKVETVPVARFDEIIPMLLKEEGDVIIGIINTEARRKLIEFTVELLPARHVVVSYKPQPVVKTVEEFREAKVGAVKGTSWAEAVLGAGVPAGKIQYYPDRVAMVEALRTGAITATAMSVSDLTLAMRRNPALQAGIFLGTPASAGWGVRKKDTALRAAFDEYLTGARKGGSWNRLVIKYFGEAALDVLGRAGKQ